VEAERVAHEERVDQAIRRLRAMADRGRAELVERKPELKDL
jgi:hypothetical protein